VITYTSVAFIAKAYPKVVGNNFMITDGLLDPTQADSVHQQLNRMMEAQIAAPGRYPNLKRRMFASHPPTSHHHTASS
jgi:uncharacterized protein (UPF0210 family)